MKSVVQAAMAFAVLSTIAALPARAMEASAPEAQALTHDYFGNTRICRMDGYFECHMWVNPDGTYVLFFNNSEKLTKETHDPRVGFQVNRGVWSVEGTKGAYKFCRKQEGEERTGCLPEPERPDMTGTDRVHVGDAFWKYHETGTLKGTTEHYYLVKGHV